MKVGGTICTSLYNRTHIDNNLENTFLGTIRWSSACFERPDNQHVCKFEYRIYSNKRSPRKSAHLDGQKSL